MGGKEMEKNADMDSYLNEAVEVEQLGQYFKKTLYAGKTITAKIMGVEKNSFNENKDDLLILVDGEKDIVKFGLSKVDKNKLVILFGPKRLDWIQKRIQIKFSNLVTWDGPNNQKRTGATSEISKA